MKKTEKDFYFKERRKDTEIEADTVERKGEGGKGNCFHWTISRVTFSPAQDGRHDNTQARDGTHHSQKLSRSRH